MTSIKEALQPILNKYREAYGIRIKVNGNHTRAKRAEIIMNEAEKELESLFQQACLEARRDEIKKLKKESSEVYVETDGYCKHRISELNKLIKGEE